MTHQYQRGLDMLLKCDVSATSTPDYQTIGGVRARKLDMNAAAVDVTNTDSAGQWKELLDNAGVKDIKMSGSGVFASDANAALVNGYFLAGTIRKWQMIVPGLGSFTVPMKITALSFDGQDKGETAYSISLASAGQPTFAAV